MISGTPRPIDWPQEFDDIRCYRNSETQAVLQRLVEDKQFGDVLKKILFPERLIKQSAQNIEKTLNLELKTLATFNSTEALQAWISSRIFPIISEGYDSLTVSGIEDLNPSDAYIFISNHRDIVMDPLLLNSVLLSTGASTANCAIGDNLLENSIANRLARLNRCFKVVRSVKSPKAILKAMKLQSSYIQRLHFTEKENIWIAQKEGRSKDNLDKTNPALIKMLGLSKSKDMPLGHYLNKLNIVPVCFSYEWDPCDIDKAIELEAVSESKIHTKAKLDDLIAIEKGLEGTKGKVAIHFGKVIKTTDEHPQAHNYVAEEIDRSIRQNYCLYPINYAAYKKINRALPENCPFDKNEVNAAYKQLEKRLKDQSEDIKKRVYNAYAAPLV